MRLGAADPRNKPKPEPEPEPAEAEPEPEPRSIGRDSAAMADAAAEAARAERVAKMSSTLQLRQAEEEEDERDALSAIAAEADEAAAGLAPGGTSSAEDEEQGMRMADEAAVRGSYEEADAWLAKGAASGGNRAPSRGADGDAARMEEDIANDAAVAAVFAEIDQPREPERQPTPEYVPDEEDEEEADEALAAAALQQEMMAALPDAAQPEEPHRPQTASAREVEQELERELGHLMESESEEEDEQGGDGRRKPRPDGAVGGEAQVMTLGDDGDDDDEAEDDNARDMERSITAGIAESAEIPEPEPARTALPLAPPAGLAKPRPAINPDDERSFVASLKEGQLADLVNRSALGGGPGRPGSRGSSGLGPLKPLQPRGATASLTPRPGSRYATSYFSHAVFRDE